MSPTDAFIFINTSDSRLPASNGARLAIRKQAMAKAAAARRQRGNYGKVNLRQLPPQKSRVTYVSHDRSDQDDTPTTGTKPSTLRYQEQTTKTITIQPDSIPPPALSSMPAPTLRRSSPERSTIPANMPLTGYEAMRSKGFIDILDLSALTTYHVSRITAQQLSTKASYLIDILRHRQWSFLSYVPSRWGTTPCLDSAVLCVFSRVHDHLSSPTGLPSPESLRQYAVAIASLQKALSDPSQSVAPDVLCATEVMALHELLASWKPKAWEYHVSGAAALIRLRGPSGYSTQYEKALLLGQIGPIFTEAVISDKPCFLEEPEWQNTLESCILHHDDMSECSFLSVSLWLLIIPIAGILHEVQSIICNPEFARQIATIALISKLQSTRSALGSWRRQYNTFVSNHVNAHSDKRMELLGVCLGSLIMTSRLLVALSPRYGQAYEDDAQGYAAEVVQLGLQAAAVNPRAGLFMAFKMALANATLATREGWQSAIWDAEGTMEDETGLIPRKPFERWCRLKGRTVGQ